MAILGNQPRFLDFPKFSGTGDGVETTYPLTWAPPSASSIIVTVQGVVQTPDVDYVVQGNDLIFTIPVANGDAFFVRSLGLPASSIVPIDGSVGPNKLAANALDNFVGTNAGDVPVVGTKSATEALAGLVELATQAEAEAGLADDVVMTPLKTAQVMSSSSRVVPFLVHVLISGTIFTPNAKTKRMFVAVCGATGHRGQGGCGGPGYSEKYYTSPLASSYNYTIGAKGVTVNTAAGTTTFDVMSVTGSFGAVNNTSSSPGGVGGVGSGGDFNSSGGTGGTANANGYSGGVGGAASRAGNGGNGGNATSSANGADGGTGGNNGSTVPGLAATSASLSALNLSSIFDFPCLESFGGLNSSIALMVPDRSRGIFGYPHIRDPDWVLQPAVTIDSLGLDESRPGRIIVVEFFY